MLLFFDKSEQVIDALQQTLRVWLHACPQLTVLVTSREPLHIEGEWEYAVDPLQDKARLWRCSTPAPVLRRAILSHTPMCGRSVRALDNFSRWRSSWPSPRVKVMSPSVLLERLLERRLPTLAGSSRDAPERQQTLRATIEWSYDLLTVEEQTLFRRLGAFVGGATFEAAEIYLGSRASDTR